MRIANKFYKNVEKLSEEIKNGVSVDLSDTE
jgi:hypothetical protein